MKKLFSLLFSVTFLLVFASFFSQKTLAACPAGEWCHHVPSGTVAQCDLGGKWDRNQTCSTFDNPNDICCGFLVSSQICTPGEKACSGNTPKTCNDVGTAWGLGTACGTNQSCIAGSCQCVVGTSLINGTCQAPPTCGSKGGICSDAAHASLYGTEITGVTCNPSSLKCYNPAPVVTTCTSTQTKINGQCYTTCPGTCQLQTSYCSDYGGTFPTGDPYCNASTTGGHPACCATSTASCGSRGGICSDAAHAVLYGAEITGVSCNPSGTKCYAPLPTTTICTTGQTKINGQCYNNCSGTCQLQTSYCGTGGLGPAEPKGDPYCNASTLGGHPVCCGNPPCDSTYTPWSTCVRISQNSCSLTGTQSRTKTDCNGVKTNETQSCTLSARPACEPPNACNTSTGVCEPPTPTPTPTGTPIPTPTIPPGTTAISLVLGLDGIGTTGDQANADWTQKYNAVGSNQNPLTPVRPVTVVLTDASNHSVTLNDAITFAPSGANKGKYTATIPLGDSFVAGNYQTKITISGHLTKLVPGFQNIVLKTTNVIPSVNLVAGDVTSDNALTANDYNILLSCVSDPSVSDIDGHALCNQNANYKVKSDLEDNDVIDKYDYNLFLREFSVQNGD
jgi:hypothetical protein